MTEHGCYLWSNGGTVWAVSPESCSSIDWAGRRIDLSPFSQGRCCFAVVLEQLRFPWQRDTSTQTILWFYTGYIWHDVWREAPWLQRDQELCSSLCTPCNIRCAPAEDCITVLVSWGEQVEGKPGAAAAHLSWSSSSLNISPKLLLFKGTELL